MSNNNFSNRCYGLSVIKSENSNFNSDFTGNPRRLPDENGTIYATDKAFKYAIRRYWIDNNKDVFVWRSHNKNGNVRTREQRMTFIKDFLSEKDDKFKNLVSELNWLEDNKKSFEKKNFQNFFDKNKKEKEQLLNEIVDNSTTKNIDTKKAAESKIEELKKLITATVFSKCIDTKLFGVTYTGDGPLSLTGPCQISYGVNRYPENTNYINDILSPYPSSEDDETTATSIGKEQKAHESYYVYDFSLNPKNIESHYNSNEEIKSLMSLSATDVDDLKSALKYSVTALDTSSKMGSENTFLLFVTMPDNSNAFLPAMKNLIYVKKEDYLTVIDLEKVVSLLNNKEIKKVEVFYNSNLTKVKGLPEKDDIWKIDENL
ncbi:MAG: type I CRISPR-associated protein Cas7 [Thermotogota bacterium]